MKNPAKNQMASVAVLTLAASLIYGVSNGLRANYGILLNPISQNSGVDYASVSFILAVAQLFVGVMQPVFGVLAMKRSNPFVLRSGVVMMAAGMLLIPFCKSFWTLLLILGLLMPSGTAALSFGIVMGVLSPNLPPRIAPAASGVVTASAGVGGTVLSPLMQGLAAAMGLLGTMAFLSVPALLLLPVSVLLCRPAGERMPKEPAQASLSALIQESIQSRDCRFLMTGFFTCGFHMAIIETHLFTQITTYGFSQKTAAYAFSAYGVAAMLGAVLSGALCGRFPMKNVLGALYASRVAMVLAFLVLPKTLPAVFGFAVLLGMTGNATVPPTSGLIESLFGTAKLAALFGVAYFCHQVGSFFSAWLGGVCAGVTDSYTLIWLVDVVLSALAAIVSFRVRRREKEAAQ